MNESENIKMFLNIGGQKITLNVPYDRQDFVREVETRTEQLYSKWRKDFPLKTDREILAMVTYQFASHYCEMAARFERATARAEEILNSSFPVS